MNAIPRCCLLVLVALAGVVPGGARAEREAELPPGARIVTAAELVDAQPQATALQARWVRLATQGAFHAVTAELGVAADPAMELALAGLARQLRDSSAARSGEGRAFLRSLGGRVPLVWMRQEESRGDWYVPAADPAGEAVSALWVIGRDEARERWAERLRADPSALAGGFSSDDDARSAAEALRMVPPETAAKAASLALREGAGWPGPVLLALAERMRSARLHRMALLRLEPAARVQAVAGLPRHLAAADAQALLRDLAADPAVGSAAVMALGNYAADPAARRWLLDRLGEPGAGASAAAALARHGGLDLVAELEQLAASAAKGAPPLLWRDLALALRLHGSPAAERALQRLAIDPALPATVAREIQR